MSLHLTPAERLHRALHELGAHYESHGSATVGDLLRSLGPQSAALAAALLALPLVSPLSLGPVTTPLSLAIGFLGWSLLRRSEAPALPARFLAVPMPKAVHGFMQSVLGRLLRWTARSGEPRPSRWLEGAPARRLCGLGVLAGGLLLAVPIPLLPLTNTFPALAVLGFTLGWCNRDLRLTGFGVGALAASVLVFVGLGFAVATVGLAAVAEVLPF
jgi:hypothetical protein